MTADQLEPPIRQRVVDLAGSECGEIALHLPFLDKREWRRRDEILGALRLERHGGSISCVLPAPAAVRDRAATLAFTDPAWTRAPSEMDPRYFKTWQSISLAVQRLLRERAAEEYFRDISRYKDRKAAYPMLVYQTARLYYGRAPSEFTYDLSDYPECEDTLQLAWRAAGESMRRLLAATEQRLQEAGMPALARRYAPVWHEDVLRAVRRKPHRFYRILARESAFLNALIDLGTVRSVAAVNRFSRTANLTLRNLYGMDLRRLALDSLEEATRLLRNGEG